MSYDPATDPEKPAPRPDTRTRTRLAWALWCVLALVVIATPWFKIPADNADSAGMQAHLHSLFVGADLLYDDEYAALHMSPLFAFVTEAGVVSNHWSFGASFLQAPGWLLGRVAGDSLIGAEVSARAARWTVPLLGLRAAAILVLVTLLVGVHRFLRARVDPGTAGLALVGFGLGTPLLYYAAESPLRPHLWGAAVVTIFVVRWYAAVERGLEDPERAAANWRIPVELGAWAGLATAIRPQLGLLVLLVAQERWLASAEHGLASRARLLVVHGLAGAAAFAPWPALIVRVQAWMYGGLDGYLGGGPGSAGPASQVSQVSHHLEAFLFSTHHGALIWCPVLVLGGLGLAIGLARGRAGALALILILAVQVWLDAGTREIEPFSVLGTRTWTGGTAFGPRKLLDVMPLLLPGVIWTADWVRGQAEDARGKWRRRLGAATVLATIPTVLLSLAAFLDPNTCSEVLDPERFVIALGLAFDPSNWALAFEQRALPWSVSTTVGAVVGLPLALVVVVGLWPRERRAGPNELAGSSGGSPGGWSGRGWTWAAAGVLVAGLGAQLWVSHLQARSAAMLEADPGRMEAAAAAMNPWHEAVVREIPSHHAVLRARLGEGAAP